MVGFGLPLGFLLLAPPNAAWDPRAPLDLAGPWTPVAEWKLRRALGDPALCRAALAPHAAAPPIADRVDSDVCHIRGGVRLSRLARAALDPVDTRCTVALRLFMWERESLQPAARELLGAEVAEIEHFSSYSCRTIRTGRGPSTWMSQHATASAIDISGFRLDDGRRITLLADWQGETPEAAFLRRAQDGLCDRFRIVLGPEHNALHADHFHADLSRWSFCR
ncbi:MAG: extensin family protein [Pseudomonadota bacterium]